MIRRLVPAGLLVSPGGRGTLTDLRFCSHTLPVIPPGERPSGLHFMAPEIRDGQPGDFTSDVYGAGAVLYYAITGVEPPLDPAAILPPTQLRAACPHALERVEAAVTARPRQLEIRHPPRGYPLQTKVSANCARRSTRALTPGRHSP